MVLVTQQKVTKTSAVMRMSINAVELTIIVTTWHPVRRNTASKTTISSHDFTAFVIRSSSSASKLSTHGVATSLEISTLTFEIDATRTNTQSWNAIKFTQSLSNFF